MKSTAILVFFSIVSLVYFLVNWYVVSRGAKALDGANYTSIFKWAYWILALSFIIGQVLERGEPTMLGRVITHIGSVWLAMFLYLLLFVLVVDLVRLIDSWFHFFPNPILSVISNGKLLFVMGWLIALTVTGLGWLNARYPQVKEVNIEIDKEIGNKNGLRIVLATDLHMGAMIGKKRMKEMIENINAQKPDIVIFGGDLVDHNPLFMKAANIGPEFLNLKAPLGVYAVAGNHEFIGHAEISINYLQEFGIQYLRDTLINVNDILQIAGRDDRERRQFEGNQRKPIDELMQNINPNLPIILVDHQPVEYAAAQQYGVDLMVSGHTHKGQLWPFGFITKAIFENDYGLHIKGKTHYYTSSGYGTWGPPVRTGNRPEIVVIKLNHR
jgi:uncharacterized protein